MKFMAFAARVVMIAAASVGAVACLWAQQHTGEDTAAIITADSRLSLGLLITLLVFTAGLVTQIIASSRANARLAQSVEDHHKLPHLTQADVEAKAAFYASTFASKELCAEKHGTLDARLERIETTLEGMRSSLQDVAKQLTRLSN